MRSSIRRSARSAPRCALVALLGVAAGACAPAGTSRSVQSVSLRGEPIVLLTGYTTIVYAHDPRGDTSFVLTDIPVQDLLDGSAREGQIMHVQLLWTPKAGATPVDAWATNVSIRHVVIAEGEVGVYGGAGFGMPRGAPGRDRLALSLRDTSVALIDATGGFEDPLSPARVTGTFVARHDPAETLKLRRALSQYVTNALGRTRIVRAEKVSGTFSSHDVRIGVGYRGKGS